MQVCNTIVCMNVDRLSITLDPRVGAAARKAAKQALVARTLAGVGVRALGGGDDRAVGELLARAHTDDVIDGHIALIVDDDDRVLTSDPDDIARLLAARGVDAVIAPT